jgi:hypothetical protein
MLPLSCSTTTVTLRGQQNAPIFGAIHPLKVSLLSPLVPP